MKEVKREKEFSLGNIGDNQYQAKYIENIGIPYEIFDHSLIANNQLHAALEITINHLKAILKLNKSKQNESTLQTIADIYASDINNQNKIISLLETLSQKVINELELNSKVMDILKEKSREIETEMIQNDSYSIKNNFNSIKEHILKMEKEFMELANACTEPDLQQSFHHLRNTKDEFEIAIYTNIGKLIFSVDIVDIAALGKIMKNFNEMKSKMINIKNNFLQKEQLYFIANTTNDIIYQIDPSKEGSNEFYLKYKHLLPYANFIIKAVDYLLCKNSDLEIKQTLSHVSEKKEISISNFHYFYTVKESLNFSDPIQTEQIELSKICTLFKDIKKINCTEFEILQNEFTISEDYFKPLNTELNAEENSIKELYEVFIKLFQKDYLDKPKIRANLSTQEKKSLRFNFCGMCFYWK